MRNANNPISLCCYERKVELGGGFRAAVLRHADKAKFQSDVIDNYETARNWAMMKAHELMCGVPYRRSSVNNGSAGHSYRANIWTY